MHVWESLTCNLPKIGESRPYLGQSTTTNFFAVYLGKFENWFCEVMSQKSGKNGILGVWAWRISEHIDFYLKKSEKRGKNVFCVSHFSADPANKIKTHITWQYNFNFFWRNENLLVYLLQKQF